MNDLKSYDQPSYDIPINHGPCQLNINNHLKDWAANNQN